MALSHEEYLKIANAKMETFRNHPLVAMLIHDVVTEMLFRTAFMNGCHSMRDHYTPVIKDLESQVLSYVEAENGEST